MRLRRRKLNLAICVLVLGVGIAAQQAPTVQGVVRDSSGAVVSGAIVTLYNASFHAATSSDSHGQFSFVSPPSEPMTLEVTAAGFLSQHQSLTIGGGSQLEIVLFPAKAKEEITVSATRTDIPLSDTPGSTILLSPADIAAAPRLRVDDMLRQVPGFSLFRRSGSRTANASSQGVSLRGLGGSAASRALVLVDGVPLVDAFGGWVYWDRIPRVSISNVEVFRGGASNLYGSDALGGVVQFLTRQPEGPALSLETSYGNQTTPDTSVWAGTRLDKWNLSAAAELFHTDGYILVPDALRGAVDTNANSEDATVYTTIGHSLGDKGRIFARGNFYTEFRHNGTPIQTNDTQIGEGAMGLDKQFRQSDSLQLRVYGDVQSYNQRFSAIAPDRNSETLTDIQHVPEQVVGGEAHWTHVLGKAHTLIGGIDSNEVIGASNELLFNGPNKARDGGGRQRTTGIFGEDIFRHASWTVILAARFDDWNNFDGKLTTLPKAGQLSTIEYPGRTETAFSPRLSVLRSVNQHLSFTGSVYRAFRAPTLNELYRTFRVGNALTYNNPALNAERLTGAEAGSNLTVLNQRLQLRGTFFWSDIVDPVANVTLSTTPNLITRQKENLGRTRSRGVEVDGIFHASSTIRFSAGYAYTDATVISYPGNPGGIDLQGLDVPQVPRNVFIWEARYWDPTKIFLSVQGRFVGRQFDDDQNQLPLDSFYAMDCQAGRKVTKTTEVFGAVENIFNQRYQVARTPIMNLGPPILFRIGLRLTYPAGKQ